MPLCQASRAGSDTLIQDCSATSWLLHGGKQAVIGALLTNGARGASISFTMGFRHHLGKPVFTWAQRSLKISAPFLDAGRLYIVPLVTLGGPAVQETEVGTGTHLFGRCYAQS